MKRFLPAILFNVLAPGTGLLVVGRPWLGISFLGFFLVGAEAAILGGLAIPASVPWAATLAGAVVAAAAWCGAQVMLAGRIRFLRRPALPRELAILRRLARAAMRREEYGVARSALTVALRMDDSDVESHILRARLLTETGRPGKAHRAWRTVRALDPHAEHAEEIDTRTRQSLAEQPDTK